MEYFFGLLALIVIIFVMMGVTVVQQGFVYTIERFGRYTYAAQPGLTIIIPFLRYGLEWWLATKRISEGEALRPPTLGVARCFAYERCWRRGDGDEQGGEQRQAHRRRDESRHA